MIRIEQIETGAVSLSLTWLTSSFGATHKTLRVEFFDDSNQSINHQDLTFGIDANPTKEDIITNYLGLVEITESEG